MRKLSLSKLQRPPKGVDALVRNLRRVFSVAPQVGVIFALVLAIGLNFAFTPYTSYAKTVGQMTPTEQAKSWLYYNALRACIDGARANGSTGLGTSKVSPAGVNDGKWFTSGAVNPSIGWPIGAMGVSVNGFPNNDSADKVECGGDNIAWISDAFRLWGYSNNLTAWCALTGGLARNDGAVCTGSASNDGWQAGEAIQALRDNAANTIKQKVYGGSDPTRSDPAKYAHAQAAFYGACLRNAVPTPYTGSDRSNTVYTDVSIVDPATGNTSKKMFAGVKEKSYSAWWSVSPNKSNIRDTCASFVAQMNDYAGAYSTEIKKRIAAGETPDAVATPGEDAGDGASTAGSSCAIEGVGWIICPTVNFMASIADSAFSFLSDSFLQVDTGIVSTSSSTYTVWSTMRTIANILFVIAFLVIIFSQLTGQGIANYGIKKILPRIIISAILVNVSFFVCQIAVDLSNILGVSLKSFFDGVGSGLDIYNSASPPSTWQSLAGGVLAGTAVAAGAWALGATVLIPMLIGAVLALIMVFFILILRQMLIVLLIVLAPLAFVAFLLPNTEQWFTKWRKMFTGLLLVFPIIGLLFGASSLVSEMLRGIYSGNGGSTIGEVIAAGLLVLPLFLLPAILKGSINAAGNIGAKINGIGDKFSRGSSSKASNSGVLKSLNNRRSIRRAQVGAGVYEGANPLSRLRSRANTRLNRSDAFNSLTGNYGTARGANIEKLDEAEIKTAEAAIKLVADSGREGDTVEAQFAMAIEKNDFVKARAAQNVLMGKGGPGVQAVLDTINTSHGAGHMSDSMGKELASNIKSFHAPTAKQKSTDLLAWSTGGGVGSITSVSGKADTWRKLTAAELSGLNDKAFASAMSSGGVSMATMEALKSERMSGQLSEAKRNAMATHTYTPPEETPITTPLGTQTSTQGTQAPQSTQTQTGTQTPQGTRPPEAPAAPATPPLDPNTLHVDHTPQIQTPIENREQAQNPTPTTEVPQRNENDQTPQAPNSGADS